MTLFSFGPDDWDEPKEDDETEDLVALGMTVRGPDDADVLEDDEETVKPVVTEDDEEIVDGLAALEKLEKELEEPELEIGEDE